MNACKCGKPLAIKAKRCRACEAARGRERRAKASKPKLDQAVWESGPSCVVSVVELEDEVTREAAWCVIQAPNAMARDIGWDDEMWGPYKTMDEADAKGRDVLARLDG